uniref:SFRICE_033934 n=1 Tax=Spodoptera frugiperda TaxID=7108 RepID=A0A2H1V468_SPOFR
MLLSQNKPVNEPTEHLMVSNRRHPWILETPEALQILDRAHLWWKCALSRFSTREGLCVKLYNLFHQCYADACGFVRVDFVSNKSRLSYSIVPANKSPVLNGSAFSTISENKQIDRQTKIRSDLWSAYRVTGAPSRKAEVVESVSTSAKLCIPINMIAHRSTAQALVEQHHHH